jgi:hypothetical protein
MEEPACELDAGVLWVHVRRRRGPDSSLARTVPAQDHRTRLSSIAKAVWLHAHPVPSLAERHPPPVEKGVEPGRGIVRPRTSKGVFRQASEREYGEILRSNHVAAEPRAPELDEGRVLPGV